MFISTSGFNMDYNSEMSHLEEMNYKDLRRLSMHYKVFQEGDKKMTLIDKLRRITASKPAEERQTPTQRRKNNFYKKEKPFFSKPSFYNRSPARMTLRSDGPSVDTVTRTEEMVNRDCTSVFVSTVTTRRRVGRRMQARREDTFEGFQNISAEQLTLVDSPDHAENKKMQGPSCEEFFNVPVVPRNSRPQESHSCDKENISAEHLTLVGSTFAVDSKCVSTEEYTTEKSCDQYTINNSSLMESGYSTGPGHENSGKRPDLKHRFPLYDFKWNGKLSDQKPDVFRFAVLGKPMTEQFGNPKSTSNVSSLISNTGNTDSVNSLIPVRVPRQKLEKQAIGKIHSAAKVTGIVKQMIRHTRNSPKKESRTILKGVRSNKRFELQMKFRQMN